METETFKDQQHDRIEEGKDLKREDEMRDLSQIPPKQLPTEKSLLGKISESISHVASTISEKVGLSEPAVEGHEDLDKDVRKQVKKVNKEILKHATAKESEVEKPSEWEKTLPKHIPNESEAAKDKAEKTVQQAAPAKPSDSTSLASKVKHSVSGISERIAHGVDLLKDKFTDVKVEGHEDLDKDVRKQVKKVNREILKHATEKGSEAEKHSDWEQTLPKHISHELEAAKDKAHDIASKAEKTVEKAAPAKPTDSTSLSSKVQHSVSGISERITHGVDALKDKFSAPKAEQREDDGTETYKTVNDGFKESVDDLKHEQRIEQLGGQEELSSKNPFQPLTSGSNEDENRTLGEKVRGGLSDASQKLSSSIGGVGQKVKSAFVHKENAPQDKENAQQIA